MGEEGILSNSPPATIDILFCNSERPSNRHNNSIVDQSLSSISRIWGMVMIELIHNRNHFLTVAQMHPSTFSAFEAYLAKNIEQP